MGNALPRTDPIADTLDPKTVGYARLWRLTVQQFSNTVSAALGKSVNLVAKFDPGSRPEDGFGIDSDKLGIDSIYASNLETVLSETLAASSGDLVKSMPCLSEPSIASDCLDRFLNAMALTSFRRPLTDAETVRYSNLFAAIKVNFSAADSLAAVAEAMLRSPYTQFRSELGTTVANNPAISQLSPYELATQIAFALTGAPPDKELLAAAEDGTLAKKEGVETQVRRLMTSDGFVNGFSDFVFRWTGITWLDEATKDAKTYPGYSADSRTAMVAESKEFLRDVLRNKRASFKKLMTSTDTTITPPLAAVYGVGTFTGSKKITANTTERSGLFTLPAVIAANSPAVQTGPAQRGVFLLRKLMCTSPPPPPANLKTDLTESDPTLTLRERFAVHSNNANCSSCHKMMDPFGFSMENYDAIGRFRDKDNGKTVDASGAITTTANSNFTFKSGVELLNDLATSKDVQECFVRQVFRYTFGRAETDGDTALINASYAAFAKSDFDMNELFATLYTSDAFRFRREK